VPTPATASAALPNQAAAPPALLLENRKNEALVHNPGDISGQDVTLRDLDGCRLLLLDRVGAVHCHNVHRCDIVIGAIGSSMLLYNCSDCTITIATKQLRLHDSERMLFHLHTLSGPVIEHSRRIAFAPHDVCYPELAEQVTAATLGVLRPATGADDDRGPWADVQDFNWHKRQASPNWIVVPRSARRDPRKFEQGAAAASAEPLPPPLCELESCQAGWEAAERGEAGSERAPPASMPSLPAAAAAVEVPPKAATTAPAAAASRLDSDDEF